MSETLNLNKMNSYFRCKLVEEIFWKQKGCCVT